MENNDYFFYLIVAASVIGSIVKFLKKKPEENQDNAPKSTGGDILKKLLQEMQGDDDYIPKNPIPVPSPAQAMRPAAKPTTTYPTSKDSKPTSSRSRNVEKSYNVPEMSQRPKTEIHPAMGFDYNTVEVQAEPFHIPLDFSSVDEAKKAIIYTEIFRTKF